MWVLRCETEAHNQSHKSAIEPSTDQFEKRKAELDHLNCQVAEDRAPIVQRGPFQATILGFRQNKDVPRIGDVRDKGTYLFKITNRKSVESTKPTKAKKLNTNSVFLR